MHTMFQLYSIKAESLEGLVGYFDKILSMLDMFDKHSPRFTLNNSVPDAWKQKSHSPKKYLIPPFRNQRAISNEVIHFKEWQYHNLNTKRMEKAYQ